jgi:hypothetical protein
MMEGGRAMILRDDWQPTLIKSWGEVVSTGAAMTDALNNLQGAAGLIYDLSQRLDRTNEKYLPDVIEEVVFQLQFISDGINDAVRRSRELSGDMIETLEKMIPAGDSSADEQAKA